MSFQNPVIRHLLRGTTITNSYHGLHSIPTGLMARVLTGGFPTFLGGRASPT
jgi:hypothetical protein